MNEFLTTDELIQALNQQVDSPVITPKHTKHKIKRIGRIVYWIIVALLSIHLIYTLIPMIFPHRAVNLLGQTTMLAIPNDQDLTDELSVQVITVKTFDFDDIKIGDRIVVYGKYGTDLYWVEEVISIDDIGQTLETTFGYFVTNTYDKNDVIATFVGHASLATTASYVASTFRGFISLLVSETLLMGLIYYYVIRKKPVNT